MDGDEIAINNFDGEEDEEFSINIRIVSEGDGQAKMKFMLPMDTDEEALAGLCHALDAGLKELLEEEGDDGDLVEKVEAEGTSVCYVSKALPLNAGNAVQHLDQFYGEFSVFTGLLLMMMPALV